MTNEEVAHHSNQIAKKNKRFAKAALLLLAAVIFAAIIIKNNVDPEVTDYNTRDNAFSISRQFVKDKLKSPSTAEFPYSTDPDVIISKINDARYIVRGYVDSQNSFGAMIRTKYICIVEHQYERTWKLVDLTFSE